MNLRRALSANFAFLTLMVLAACMTVAATASVILRQRNVVLAEALEHGSQYARAFEEYLTHNLETVQRIGAFLAGRPEPEDVEFIFRQTLRQSPFLRSLSLVDADGRIVFSSNPGNVGRRIEAGEYIPTATSDGDTLLRVGRPWSGRDFEAGGPITADRPVSAGEIAFVPVLSQVELNGRTVRLAAALNPDFFINYFSRWLDPEQGIVEVVRYDQVVLMASGERNLIGEGLGDGQLAAMLPDAEIGQYADARADERETLTAYRASRQFPLVVVTRLYRDRALEPWRQESGRLLLMAVPMLLGLLYLATVLYRRERRITAEQEAARRREYERLAATVFETVLEAVVVTDANQRIVAVNPAFTRITGYSREEALGAEFSMLASGYHAEEFYLTMQRTLAGDGKWAGEVRHRRKNGEIFVAWQSVSQVRDEGGRIVHQVTGLSDITDYCAEAERISHLAHHDLLTGLPNRALLLDRLRQGLHRAQRDQQFLALLFFDLDKFKPVNDTLGHTVGDRLLQALAARLKDEIRAVDTLARLGGDEFVILLPAVKNRRAGVVVAEKIRQAAEQPFQIDQHLINVSTSIGIAFYPDHATESEGLMRCADIAMYRAKTDGGNRFAIYRADRWDATHGDGRKNSEELVR